MKIFIYILMTVLIGTQSFAETPQHLEASNRIRLKLFYNNHVDGNMSPGETDSSSIDFDYSKTLIHGVSLPFIPDLDLGMGLSASDVFFASGLNLYAAALTPTLSKSFDRWHIYGGPSFGVLADHEETFSGHRHLNEFALGFNAGADFTLSEDGSWFLNNSFRYLNSKELRLSGLGIGIGLKF